MGFAPLLRQFGFCAQWQTSRSREQYIGKSPVREPNVNYYLSARADPCWLGQTWTDYTNKDKDESTEPIPTDGQR